MELAVALAAGLAAVGLLAAYQRQFVYFPTPREVPPAAAVLPHAEDVSFETDDGLRLAAWYLPPRAPRRASAVLVCNGNAGNRAHRAPLATALSRAGVAVLLFDYRGYGGNAGSPTEAGLLADARAAARHLASRADVDPDRIIYFGESLGAAVALALALERPPAGLVLRSPFTSLADMRRHHYPLLPFDFLLLDRYPSMERIAHVRVPLLVIAGERDAIVPPAQSRRLFDAASEPKRFVLIDADHNDPALLDGAELVDAVLRFAAQFAQEPARH